jgi:fatty acid desaturase
VFTSLQLYRPYHLAHHRHTQQAEDPDLSLSAPFPITARSLWRKIGRDLSGRTAYQRRLEQIRCGLAKESEAFIVNLALLGGLSAIGYWWLYPLLWLLPLATWYQLVSRIRNIAEHAVVPDNDDPLRNTRTTRANFFERLLVAPYWVNYHLEHHLFMFVPCWRLPAAHRALLAAGMREQMEIQPGYAAVLRLATSRRAGDDAQRRDSPVLQHL